MAKIRDESKKERKEKRDENCNQGALKTNKMLKSVPNYRKKMNYKTWYLLVK